MFEGQLIVNDVWEDLSVSASHGNNLPFNKKSRNIVDYYLVFSYPVYQNSDTDLDFWQCEVRYIWHIVMFHYECAMFIDQTIIQHRITISCNAASQ